MIRGATSCLALLLMASSITHAFLFHHQAPSSRLSQPSWARRQGATEATRRLHMAAFTNGDELLVGAGSEMKVVPRPVKAPVVSVPKVDEAMVIVDPYSSGGVLARKVHDRGYKVVRVLSQSAERMADQSLPACCDGLKWAATIQDHGDVEETMQKIRDLGLNLSGFLCGAEPGVELFDAITTRWGGKLGRLNNGEELSHCRRDKYLMGEKVREAGLRAVKQVRASSWEQVESFITELYPNGPTAKGMNIILKPLRSSSSEDVVLAHTVEEAYRAFTTIKGKKNQYGDENESVLVQEYMKGSEYVVNCISHNGEHKVVSMWKYDKRQVNGGQFVYFAVNLFESADGVIEARLGDYIRGVLNALDIKHGPSHAEVMWLDEEDQPCLVEIGSRAHGGDGVHQDLADACIGYNQLDSMIDLVEGDAVFQALPLAPPRLKAHASVVIMVSYESGILRSYPGMEQVRALPSFKRAELKVKPNSKLSITSDYLTNPGWITLLHPEAEVVRQDAATIHRLALEKQMYEVEQEEEKKEEEAAAAEVEKELVMSA